MLYFMDIEYKDITKSSNFYVVVYDDKMKKVKEYSNKPITGKDDITKKINLIGDILEIISAIEVNGSDNILIGYNMQNDLTYLKKIMKEDYSGVVGIEVIKDNDKQKLDKLALKAKNSSFGELIFNYKDKNKKLDVFELVKYKLLNSKVLLGRYINFCLSDESRVYATSDKSFNSMAIKPYLRQEIIAEYNKINTGDTHTAISDTKTLVELYKKYKGDIANSLGKSSGAIYQKTYISDAKLKKYGYSFIDVKINGTSLKIPPLRIPVGVDRNVVDLINKHFNEIGLNRSDYIDNDATININKLKSDYVDKMTIAIENSDIMNTYTKINIAYGNAQAKVLERRMKEKTKVTEIHKDVKLSINKNDVDNVLAYISRMSNMSIEGTDEQMINLIESLRNSRSINEFIATKQKYSNIYSKINELVIISILVENNISREEVVNSGLFSAIQYDALINAVKKFNRDINSAKEQLGETIKKNPTTQKKKVDKDFLTQRIMYLSNLYYTGKKSNLNEKTTAIAKATRIATLEKRLIETTSIEFTLIEQFMKDDVGNKVSAGVEIYFHYLNDNTKNGIFFNAHPHYKDKNYVTVGFNRNDKGRKFKRRAEYYILKGVDINILTNIYLSMIYNGGSIGEMYHEIIKGAASRDSGESGKKFSYIRVNSYYEFHSQMTKIKQQIKFLAGTEIITDFRDREMKAKNLKAMTPEKIAEAMEWLKKTKRDKYL